MDAFFRQQLADYADHHRDPRNRTLHYIGIPLLFLAVILPLGHWPVDIGGLTVTLAPLMTAIGVIGWLIVDRVVGLAMIVAVAPFVVLAQWIALRLGAVAVWSLAGGLLAAGTACLAVGHAVFEHQRPAFADNLFQSFVAPMFFVAKVLVALGLRRDLADALEGTGGGLAADPYSGGVANLHAHHNDQG